VDASQSDVGVFEAEPSFARRRRNSAQLDPTAQGVGLEPLDLRDQIPLTDHARSPDDWRGSLGCFASDSVMNPSSSASGDRTLKYSWRLAT
jgi:hypothetical protein